jgi:hypothetical protein
MNNGPRSFLLWISVPLSIVLAATGFQAFWPAIYRQEKPASAVGAVTSDIFGLCVVLPTLVLSAVLARRGSLSALLVWTGPLGFLTYNFLIYAFAVHFNAMLPAYCAVLGLSFYGLMGVREVLLPGEVAKTYGPAAPRRSIAATFILLAVVAGADELKEIVSAISAGQVPASVTEAGQRTNPIHVLDLSFLLPALVIAAVMLLRQKETAFTLAPVLSVVLILIGLEVTAMVVALVRGGLAGDSGPAVFFGMSTALLGVLLVWYLHRPERGRTEEPGGLA